MSDRPAPRLRRLRARAGIRRLFQEQTVELRRLVMPYFVVPGTDVLCEVKAGSGLWQVSASRLVEEVGPLVEAGVGGVMLFGVPAQKQDFVDPSAASIQASQLEDLLAGVRLLRAAYDDLVLFADVCLCSYTTHGHCGVAVGDAIDNDRTLPWLAAMAVHLGHAGVDFVAPSDMMDGRVAAVRAALDQAGLGATGVLSYAVKTASAFYGPFRLAADSAPAFGDRCTYQLPPANRREARRAWRRDAAEGADALLVKPALPNLDLLRDCRERSDLPLFAYQVSGERAMLAAAAAQGLFEYERAMQESLLSMFRAGADVVVTYEARALAQAHLARK